MTPEEYDEYRCSLGGEKDMVKEARRQKLLDDLERKRHARKTANSRRRASERS